MKRLLILLSILVFALAGCGSDSEKSNAEEKKDKQVKEEKVVDGLVFGKAQEWYDWGIETMEQKEIKKKKFDYTKEIAAIAKDDAEKDTKAMAMTYMAKMYKASEDELNTFLNELIGLYEKDTYISTDENVQLITLFKSYAVERYTKKTLDEAKEKGVDVTKENLFYMNSFVTNMSNSIKYVYRGAEPKGGESYLNYRSIMEKQLNKISN